MHPIAPAVSHTSDVNQNKVVAIAAYTECTSVLLVYGRMRDSLHAMTNESASCSISNVPSWKASTSSS